MYIDTLILPTPQYHQKALDRAFGVEGRMSSVADLDCSGGYGFSPFKCCKTDVEFALSRRNATSSAATFKGSNICAVYTPNLEETLINGVLQGRRQFDGNGGSALCNARMYDLVYQISVLLGMPSLNCIRENMKYEQLKQCGLLQARRKTKDEIRRHALKGWIRNVGDDFELPRR